MSGEFMEALKRLTPEDVKEVIKALKLLKAIPNERVAQFDELIKQGVTVDEIAERWGIEICSN